MIINHHNKIYLIFILKLVLLNPCCLYLNCSVPKVRQKSLEQKGDNSFACQICRMKNEPYMIKFLTNKKEPFKTFVHFDNYVHKVSQ